MKDRCYNKNTHNYKNYGGRGITICNEWKESFATFYKDMGERPAGKTLDRIDNNGQYSKCNCRWASPKAQGRNRRNNRLITVRGTTKTLAEWSEKFNLSSVVISSRIKRGESPERALSRPVRLSRRLYHGYPFPEEEVKEIKLLIKRLSANQEPL